MAPRKLKAHRQGCWIEATGSGLLRLRFRWRLPTATGLHKFSETTTLRDTAENRATLSKQAAIIGAEIAADRFDYLRWFPNGSRAIHFRRTRSGDRSTSEVSTRFSAPHSERLESDFVICTRPKTPTSLSRSSEV